MCFNIFIRLKLLKLKTPNLNLEFFYKQNVKVTPSVHKILYFRKVKNLYSILLLLLFISFQFSNSCINFIDNCNDKNIAIEFQDEEEENSKESKESKELKLDFIGNKNLDFAFLSNNQNTKIDAFCLISEYKEATTITILPPEKI